MLFSAQCTSLHSIQRSSPPEHVFLMTAMCQISNHAGHAHSSKKFAEFSALFGIYIIYCGLIWSANAFGNHRLY
jgi:hypothetical protein